MLHVIITNMLNIYSILCILLYQLMRVEIIHYPMYLCMPTCVLYAIHL